MRALTPRRPLGFRALTLGGGSTEVVSYRGIRVDDVVSVGERTGRVRRLARLESDAAVRLWLEGDAKAYRADRADKVKG